MTMAVSVPSFTFKPIGFFHRHYIIHDSMFRKVGTLDFIDGLWILSTLNGNFQYKAISRDKAIQLWFAVM